MNKPIVEYKPIKALPDHRSVIAIYDVDPNMSLLDFCKSVYKSSDNVNFGLILKYEDEQRTKLLNSSLIIEINNEKRKQDNDKIG